MSWINGPNDWGWRPMPTWRRHRFFCLWPRKSELSGNWLWLEYAIELIFDGKSNDQYFGPHTQICGESEYTMWLLKQKEL